MKILAIDTSCDETACAVTNGTKILSNIIWSQASAHAKFGGVMPSLARRMHEERIDWVVERAMTNAKCQMTNINAVAVTVGPGLSIALGVGIDRAKKLASKYNKPLIPVNHVEAHLLSPYAESSSSNLEFRAKTRFQIPDSIFPKFGLVVSGGNTVFVLIEKIGKYKILAETQDDALGEALDKGARMLGLGYPGGAILEKMTKLGDAKKFSLPIPLVGQEKRQIFSYSGLKTSFYRLIQANPPKTKQDIYDLAAAFQNVAFKHLLRVIEFRISSLEFATTSLLLGGGVAANVELKRRLRKLGKKYGFKVRVPYSKKLYGDNAGMIGVAAYFKAQRGEFISHNKIDRNPNLKI